MIGICLSWRCAGTRPFRVAGGRASEHLGLTGQPALPLTHFLAD